MDLSRFGDGLIGIRDLDGSKVSDPPRTKVLDVQDIIS